MRPLGLRSRLVLAISLLIAGMATFFAVYFLDRQESAANDALEKRALGVCGILAKLIATAVDFEDARDATTQLEALRGHPDLRYVVVLKSNGAVFARVNDGGVPELLEGAAEEALTRRGDLLHARVPLHSKSGPVGTLVAGFSRESIMATRKASQSTALTMSGIIFVGGLMMAWVLSGGVARPLARASNQLRVLSENLVGLVQAQQGASQQQAAGIEETRRSMDMMLRAAQQIAESSRAVLGNAERTVKGNHDVAHRIEELNVHAEKVAEILATIMQVADRTDLLALNAALEGTKAGEAGRGFTLVAGEMRRLAENVMESVAGIRRLLNDVRGASHAAVQAGREGIALSEETTRSAGEIALVTQQQRQATEQVGRNMDEMATAVGNTMSNTRQAALTAVELAEMASTLTGLIGRTAGEAPPPPPAAAAAPPASPPSRAGTDRLEVVRGSNGTAAAPAAPQRGGEGPRPPQDRPARPAR
jgi:methyl-accepting chemotaxis protein